MSHPSFRRILPALLILTMLVVCEIWYNDETSIPVKSLASVSNEINKMSSSPSLDIESKAPKTFRQICVKKMDILGKADPFVRVFMMPEKHDELKTKTIKKTFNPVFNESFQFKVGIKTSFKGNIFPCQGGFN